MVEMPGVHVYTLLYRVLLVQTALIGFTVLAVGVNRLFGNRLAARTQARRRRILERIRDVVLGEPREAELLLEFETRSLSDVMSAAAELEDVVVGEGWERVIRIMGQSRVMRQARRHAFSRLILRRIHASQALGYAANAQDEWRIKRLLDDAVPAVRINALRAVRRIPSPALIRQVVWTAAGRTGFGDVPYLEVLYQNRSLALPVVKEILQEFRDWPQAARICLKFLSRVSDPSSRPIVLQLSGDPDPDIRASAVRALGQIPTAATEARLLECLKDDSWEVRGEAVRSLGKIHAGAALNMLEERLSDNSWWVRMNAAMAIRRMGPAGERMLKGLCVSDDVRLRDMAGYALAVSPANIESD